MERRALLKIVEEYKAKLGINENVRVRLKEYKTKAASINMKKAVITLNKNVLDLGEDVIRYLILHELVHLKLKSPYHDVAFKEMLMKYSQGLDIELIKSRVLNKLLKLNNVNKRVKVD